MPFRSGIFVILVVSLFISHLSSAASIDTSVRELFKSGRAPSASEANMDWRCFNPDEQKKDQISCGSSYGFSYKNGKFIVPEHMDKLTPDLDSKTLVFKGFTSDHNKSFLAVRIAQTSSGQRLIMEESGSIPSWQKPGDKSSITGFTPNLYTICIPSNELNNFALSNLSTASQTGTQSTPSKNPTAIKAD